MDCDGLRRVLFDHVDGLLGRDDAEAARDHLAACGPCRALQEEVRRNFTAMDAWEEEELPAGAFERLQARIPSGPTPVVDGAPRVAPAHAAHDGEAPRRSFLRLAGLRLAVPYAAGLATAAAAAWVFLLPVASPHPDRPGAGVPGSPGFDVPRAGGDMGVRPVALNDSPVRGTAGPELNRTGLRPGERKLEFRDFSNGVLRNFRLPGDVDTGKIMLIETPRRIVPDDEGVK